MNRLFLMFLLFLYSTLSACGGGGSASKPPSQKPLENQIISFKEDAPPALKIGDTFSNPISALGNGSLTYSSSNLAVATIDQSGNVKVVGAGTTIITAAITADEIYKAASKSYTLSISKLVQDVSINDSPSTYLVGDNFSWIVTGQGSGGVTYSSSDESIAIINANGDVKLLGSGPVTLTANVAEDAQYLPKTASLQFDVAGQPQTIAFQISAEIVKNFGDGMLINLATAPGSGAITYSSSETAVATINSLGTVTIIGAGTTTIYAKIAADKQFSQAETSYQLKVNPIPQTLNFGTVGPIKVLAGSSFFNQALGSGSGAISYYSSESTIASVIDGEVNVHAPGKTIITAKIAADKNFLESSASYEVKSGFQLRGWIGANDTLLKSPVDVYNFNLFRSSSANCDLVNFTSCTDGQASLLNENEIVDTTTSLNRSGYYLFKNGNNEISHVMKADISNSGSNVYAPFKARRGHQAINFKGKIWVIGGEADNGNTLKNDIWSTTDGVTWIAERNSAEFSHRSFHKLIEFNNKLWLIGGSQYSTKLNDIWSSSDGINWSLETGSAQFSGRTTSVIEFNGKLWIIGGFDSDYRNDIWSSSDGDNWTKEVNQAPFVARDGHALIAFNNKLFLIGGTSTNGRLDDIWSSQDGVNWNLENPHSGFSPRETSVTIFDNKVWLVGGLSENGRTNDVWSSNDGITWIEETPSAEFTSRSFHQLISFENKLFVIAGDDANSATDKDFVGDVWRSENGINWRIGYNGIVYP